MGNVGSIQNMLKKIGVENCLAASQDDVQNSSALIIPGVGHFDNAIEKMRSNNLIGALNEASQIRKIPILGICLGMQLMTRGSEEGSFEGLGWIQAETKRIIVDNSSLKVPHMGWNLINLQKHHPAFEGDGLEEHRFYFVHSYAVYCDNQDDILCTTNYGNEFVSAFSFENLTGVQFHPEKSHMFGNAFFRNYASRVWLNSQGVLSN
jgi:glutamine amidotransferase